MINRKVFFNEAYVFVEEDTLPILEFSLTYADDTIVDLTGATVLLKIISPTEEVLNEGHQECIVTDGANGKCQYVFEEDDLQIGVNLAELKIEFTTFIWTSYEMFNFIVRPKIGEINYAGTLNPLDIRTW